jgi:hypothetical protein
LTVDNYSHFDLNLSIPQPPTLQLDTRTNCPNGSVLMGFLGPYLFLNVPDLQGAVAYWGTGAGTRVKSVGGSYKEASPFPIGNGAYSLDFVHLFYESDQCEQINSKYCPPPQP